MSISLFSVLKMIPWSTVISNAPEIADGARKLWKAVASKAPGPDTPATNPQAAVSPEMPSLDILQTQLADAEAKIACLHQQMRESAELLKALADQNSQLVKRVAVDRIRVLWLTGFVAVLSLVTMITLTITLTR